MKIQVTKNTIQGTIWGVVGKLLSIIFPFVIRTIIIRKIGVEYAGLGSLFVSILQVLNVAELGFGTAIVFSMYKPVSEDDTIKLSALLKYFRKIYYIIGFGIFAAGLMVMPFLKDLIYGDVPSDVNLYVLYLLYLLTTVSTYLFFGYTHSILSAYQREADNNKISMAVMLLTYLLQIIFLLLFENIYIYTLLLPISSITINIIRYFYVKKKYPLIKCEGNITIEEKKRINSDVRALFVFKMGGAVVNSLDSIVISIFLGLVMVSNYNNYYSIVNALNSMILIIFSTLTAGIGNRLLLNSRNANKADFDFILFINGLIVTVFSVCLFSLFQDFICVWVGQKYLFDFKIMCLFVLYFFCNMIRRTVLMYRDAAGLWKQNVFQPIVSSLLNITLNIILISFIGIYGVLISTIISIVLIDIPWESTNFFKIVFKSKPIIYFSKILYYLLICIIGCLTCCFVFYFLNISNQWISLFVKLLLSFLVGTLLFSFLTLFQRNNIKKLVVFAFRRTKKNHI